MPTVEELEAEKHCGYGYGYLSEKQFSLAIAEFTWAIYLDPKSYGAYKGRASAYAELDNQARIHVHHPDTDPMSKPDYEKQAKIFFALKELDKKKADRLHKQQKKNHNAG